MHKDLDETYIEMCISVYGHVCLYIYVYTHTHIYVCVKWKERKMTHWILRQAFSRFQNYTTLSLKTYKNLKE